MCACVCVRECVSDYIDFGKINFIDILMSMNIHIYV